MDRAWPETVKQLQVGDGVKKVFLSASGVGEGMWIAVDQVFAWGVLGRLVNEPVERFEPPVQKGMVVAVNLHEIIDWIRDHPGEV